VAHESSQVASEFRSLLNRHWDRFNVPLFPFDRFCGLVVRVPGYRSRRPGCDSQRYQIFWEVVGLERGPLSLVITIEKLHGRKSGGSGLENRDYGCRESAALTSFIPQKLALTPPTSGGRSFGIVRSRTQATEFFCSVFCFLLEFRRVCLYSSSGHKSISDVD
jgi:hypothetical protein